MKRKLLWATALLILLLLVALLVSLGVGGARQRAQADAAAPAWLTQPAERGRIARVIQASGTLQPVNQVQVGTQVSGTVARLHVDFNDRVKAGQLLASIEPTLLQAERDLAAAQLDSAQASLQLAQQRRERAQNLFSQGFSTRAELDEAEAGWAAAQAARRQQQAAVARAQRNLANAQIRSPVNGTVVSREVSVGQTVAANFATPLLFKIAEDLREMQIEAAVSEADIGLLQIGQAVSYTVDAFADQRFEGQVQQIRNNYGVQQNVVTYTVVIRTRNDSERLRPGMTAYLKVQVAERASALRVPNAALRFAHPDKTQALPALEPGQGRVWRLGSDGQPQPLTLRLGISDGSFTEVLDADSRLQADTPLVVATAPEQRRFGPRIF